MYDVYESDMNLFDAEISKLLENKDKEKFIELTYIKHKEETKDKIPLNNKKNDLIAWNVLFTREIIKNGPSKLYIHTLYNKFYNKINSIHTLLEFQTLEIDMINSYFDILINYIESKDNLTINKLIGILYIHIEDKITLEDISNEINLSVGYISNIFKETMGMSIMKYLKKLKIERAKVLLESTNKSILEIATLLSFCDQSNFTKAFKSFVGVTPINYRLHPKHK